MHMKKCTQKQLYYLIDASRFQLLSREVERERVISHVQVCIKLIFPHPLVVQKFVTLKFHRFQCLNL